MSVSTHTDSGKLCSCVLQTALEKSKEPTHRNPPSSNPLESPPAPQKRSMKVGLFLFEYDILYALRNFIRQEGRDSISDLNILTGARSAKPKIIRKRLNASSLPNGKGSVLFWIRVNVKVAVLVNVGNDCLGRAFPLLNGVPVLEVLRVMMDEVRPDLLKVP